MSTVSIEETRHNFGLGASDGLLIVDPISVNNFRELNGQGHYIKRAFDRLSLDGVLCIDGTPTVFLRVNPSFAK